MGEFQIRIDAPLPASEAFARVLDLDAHSEVIPLTSVQHAGIAPGTEFVARTGLGPLGVDDEMVIEECVPPTEDRVGHCRIRKLGNLIGGEIALTVTPTGEHTSVVLWDQTITIAGASRFADPMVTQLSREAYRTMLKRLLSRAT